VAAPALRYFRLVARDIEIAPLLAELRTQENAWLANITRQHKSPAQRQTQTILLRGPTPREDVEGVDNHDCMDKPMAVRFPITMGMMSALADRLGGSLGRAMIVRLKPRSSVGRHVDGGAYYAVRDRYHLVLDSPSGSVLQSGDEDVRMWPGELWWFDNKQLHAARNDSNEWRVHCIFDLLPDRSSPAPGRADIL